MYTAQTLKITLFKFILNLYGNIVIRRFLIFLIIFYNILFEKLKKRVNSQCRFVVNLNNNLVSQTTYYELYYRYFKKK